MIDLMSAEADVMNLILFKYQIEYKHISSLQIIILNYVFVINLTTVKWEFTPFPNLFASSLLSMNEILPLDISNTFNGEMITRLQI